MTCGRRFAGRRVRRRAPPRLRRFFPRSAPQGRPAATRRNAGPPLRKAESVLAPLHAARATPLPGRRRLPLPNSAKASQALFLSPLRPDCATFRPRGESCRLARTLMDQEERQRQRRFDIDFCVNAQIVSIENREFSTCEARRAETRPVWGAAPCLVFRKWGFAVPRWRHELGVRASFFGRRTENPALSAKGKLI